MKKQFLRVKQIADQTFLRAEKSDVLTEDLLIAEKRVDSIKASCQATQKKITSCQIDFGSETSVDKRLRKIPQVLLGTSMLESGSSFSKNSVLGDTLRECATVQTKLGSELYEYYAEVERCMLRPVSGILDNEVHNINKLRKQLGKLVLDMDSARTRFQTAERHSLQQGNNNNNLNAVKVDNLKEEMEEASQKVEQCRDALATEMFSLIGREPHLARLFLQLHQLQAAYHRNALAALEASLPMLENLINNFPQKPVYGCSLEEHLRVTDREVAQVVDTSVSFLLEYGVLEEGLLRVAGSAIKMKKLKSAFDAGIELDMEEYMRDPHAVAGAFKSYLRELPEPLLTNILYNDWMNAAKQTDFESKLQALWQVLHRLPSVNFKNLKFVVKFLAKVQENMDVNKMSSQNIAIVMAPNLIWSPTEESTTIGMNMSTASLHTSIVDLLISYADWFFPEDSENALPDPRSSPLPNMNDQEEGLKEVNGNTLDVVSSAVLPPSSPRSPQNKNFRKPAAPPPPAQRSLEPPGPLIDLLADNPESRRANPSNHVTQMPYDVVRREHSNELGFHRAIDKPIVPEKPSYSSCSLDRKSLRHCPNRPSRPPSDGMSRSHVERPSVPPPERPDKAARSSSQENLAVLTVNPGDPRGLCEETASSKPVSSSLKTCNPGADTATDPHSEKFDETTEVLESSAAVPGSSVAQLEGEPQTKKIPSMDGIMDQEAAVNKDEEVNKTDPLPSTIKSSEVVTALPRASVARAESLSKRASRPEISKLEGSLASKSPEAIPRPSVARPEGPTRKALGPEVIRSQEVNNVDLRPSMTKSQEAIPRAATARSEGHTRNASGSEVIRSQEVHRVEGGTVQRSRSASKMNRFDFLVSQREERPPPERPPRSTEVQASAEEPPIPKTEVERAKPPRPQPPAKPKMNLLTENTNL